jgi:hypothetical protein
MPPKGIRASGQKRDNQLGTATFHFPVGLMNPLPDAAAIGRIEVDAAKPGQEKTVILGKFAQTDKNSHRISSIFVTCAWKNAQGR